MFRARLASVVVAASLAASGGCHVFDQHPLFGRGHRDGCPGPAGCCDPGITAGSGPIIEGPILAPTEPFVPGNGQLPVFNQPRLQTIPQSIPMPYTP